MTAKGSIFEYQARLGLTKHFGQNESTARLSELCHIKPGQVILDAGCGSGVTACLLAEQVGVRVVGVDLLPGMVDRARERAARAGLQDRVTFEVADIRDLPFPDDTFDAVVVESVTAFPSEKQRAVSEYARVTKPGGYVGLNETTWLKTPAPPAVTAYISQDLSFGASFLTAVGWSELLTRAGLTGVTSEVIKPDQKAEARGLMKRYGYGFMMGTMLHILKWYLTDANYREAARNATSAPPDIMEYVGYGLYTGQKPAS